MSRFVTVLHQLEQAAERSLREAEKQEKARLNAELHALASKAVETYHEVIADLTTAHKAKIEIIHWKERLQDPGPIAPVPTHRYEQTAQHRFEAYHAGFVDTLFNMADRKRKTLQKGVEAARRQDQLSFEQANAEYTRQHRQWVTMQTLAGQISAALYPETLARLNFDGVDLSQVLGNFQHNIQFNKTTGFKPVAQLDPRPPESSNK